MDHIRISGTEPSSVILTQTKKFKKLKTDAQYTMYIKSFEKTFGKFFRSYSEFLSKFGDTSFQEYVSKGISHPVFYYDLVYKLRRVKDTPNVISSGSKIVKRLRRRQYRGVWPIDNREDYMSCALPFYILVHTFPKALSSY